MSKGNMLQGQARGKVGDLVFYVRNGGQQTRVRNRQPSNPRTKATMNQRVKLASVVGFYKRQAAFFKFALKKTAKESYYNAFVRYNINVGPYYTKEEVTDGTVVPAPWIISDGNLPSISITRVESNDMAQIICETDLPVTARTWGDVRVHYGLRYGDMLTFVAFVADDVAQATVRRIVSQHVFDYATDDMIMGEDMVGLMFSTQEDYIEITALGDYFGVTDATYVGAALVLSSNNGKIDCSYAQLSLNQMARSAYVASRTSAKQDEAAASYGALSSAILDPRNADSNTIDMVQLYSDSALMNGINSISIESGGQLSVYFDASKLPGLNSVAADRIAGYNSIEEIGLNSAKTAIDITSVDGDDTSGTYRISFMDANSNFISQAYLVVNVP